jgi:three-Cys-motif partner protein
MPSDYQPDFFNELKEWSERKLRLLEKYVEPAVRILGSSHGLVYYVDGFAGRGVYDDEAQTKGSPVRIAKLAEKFEHENRSYQLICINIEANPDNFLNLVSSTELFGDKVQNLVGSFGENTEAVLQRIGTHPAVCFLDPFGVKGIDLAAIEKIVKRKAPTDLWIRFDPGTVRRLDGFFDDDSPQGKKQFSILPGIYGVDDWQFLHDRLSGITAEDRLNNALKLYREQLVNLYGKAKGGGYVGSYAIRTLTGQVKYHLVFATAHHRGVLLANEIICDVEESYQIEVQEFKDSRTHQIDMFVAQPSEEEIFTTKVDRLRADIWEAARGKELSHDQIYLSVLGKWFGRIKGKHLNAALNSMKNTGQISHADGPTSHYQTKFQFKE